MSRKFIATIVALSLTVSGITATQAQAGDKRTRNLIVGATTLAIIGAAIASQDRKDRGAHVGTQNPRPRGHGHGYGQNPRHNPKYGYDDRDRRNPFANGPRHDVQPRPLPPRAHVGQLPRHCLRTLPTRDGGTIRMFGARCLKKNYGFADSLPRECRQKIWTRNGTFRGYSPRCLRQYRYSANNNWLDHK
jgi:hypothetical protein